VTSADDHHRLSVPSDSYRRHNVNTYEQKAIKGRYQYLRAARPKSLN
jgi:hypothetical protein